MTRWWVAPAFIAGSVVAGFVAGRWAAPPEVVTRTETREVVRNVESKANAEATVRVVEVAGPTVTRWRTAPAAPGCPEVREVIQEAGPVERIVQQATRTSMESSAKERTNESTVVVADAQDDWAAVVLAGTGGLDVRERWFVGAIVQRRILGPISAGAIATYGVGRGVEAGLSLGVNW